MNVPGIYFKKLPRRWIEGVPLGNGEIGVMCWAKDRQLKFTFDSASAWDLRHTPPQRHHENWPFAKLRALVEKKDFDTIKQLTAQVKLDPLRPRKLFLGRFELAHEFAADCAMRLSLEDGLWSGTLRSKAGKHTLTAFVARTEDLFVLRLKPWPARRALTFCPFYEATPELAKLGHPEVQRSREGKLELALQHILPDQFLCVCWNPSGPDVIVALGRGKSADEARQQALRKHGAAAGLGFESHKAAHTAAWRAFWATSAVALPEQDMEFLWYFGVYLLASAARKGSNPPNYQGVWTIDGNYDPWRGDYHGNINVQETLWPACPSGHLELLDVWLDHMHASLPVARDLTRKVFGTDGAFMVCAFLPGYTTISDCCWDPVGLAWSTTAFLAHLAWLRWRYSMDTAWLRKCGYPIVQSAFVFYSSNLELEADGRYHVPLSSSPEYLESSPESWAKDPNVDIALIRRCCDWIVEMEQALGISDQTARAHEIHAKLVPYHLVEHKLPLSNNARPSQGPFVLAAWKDHPLDRSHRHPSHLMAIHPAMDITVDGSETDRKIIDFSLLHYLSLGQYFWATHTYGQMVSMAAVIGRADMAYNYVRRFRDTCLLPNGALTNATGYQGSTFFARPLNDEERVKDVLHQDQRVVFVIDATCGISCGLSDMLLQGWNDIIRVFPATPNRWTDALFVDLLTEGAFRVSALKKDGAVRWVRIRATVARQCRLRNPFADQPFKADGADPQRDGNLLVWPMKAGQTVTLYLPGHANPDIGKEQERIRLMNVTTLNVDRLSRNKIKH